MGQTNGPSALLLGRDHPELGASAVEAVGDVLAVALTRGTEPKTYAYVDPNEDVAAAVAGRAADLLVVADGHNGCPAAEVAVQAVLDRLGHDPPAALADRELVTLFWEANEAVRKATAALPRLHAASRSTLTVCLAGPERVQWGAMGDSSLILIDDGAGREVTRQRHQFLGDAVSLPELAGRMIWGSTEIQPDTWVIALTDGFSNFAAPARQPAVAAAAALAGVQTAADAAMVLLDHAAAGGAGDNVAVALRAPRS